MRIITLPVIHSCIMNRTLFRLGELITGQAVAVGSRVTQRDIDQRLLIIVIATIHCKCSEGDDRNHHTERQYKR